MSSRLWISGERPAVVVRIQCVRQEEVRQQSMPKTLPVKDQSKEREYESQFIRQEFRHKSKQRTF